VVWVVEEEAEEEGEGDNDRVPQGRFIEFKKVYHNYRPTFP
jgi:hypothetical protein